MTDLPHTGPEPLRQELPVPETSLADLEVARQRVHRVMADEFEASLKGRDRRRASWHHFNRALFLSPALFAVYVLSPAVIAIVVSISLSAVTR